MLYNWKVAPSWARWAARDSNGFAHWFAKLPLPHFSEFGVEWLHVQGTECDSNCDPFWLEELHCPDAKLSLEARPSEAGIANTEASIKTITKYIHNKNIKDMHVTFNMYLNLADRLFKLSNGLPTDPLHAYVGKQILVHRPQDTVVVSIMRYKASGRYTFVNLSKDHICTCSFNTVLEAFDDLEKQKKLKKVVSWKFIK